MAKQSKDKCVNIIDGEYYARVTYFDEYGKKRQIRRKAENKTHAKELVRQIKLELEQHGANSVSSSQMTFLDLVQYYEKTYLIEPKYVDGRKVAGLRGYKRYKFVLDALRNYFGKKKLRSITHGDIQTFRLHRLETPTRQGNNKRTLTTVNRELAMLRRMLNIALREGWILKTPFATTDKLISAADEKKRERILTKDEENLLLANCIGLRSHLKAIIICALDTGMRAGEIFSLKWRNINFDQGVITIESLNTKTLQSRQVALTARLKVELTELFDFAKSLDDLIFGLTTVKHAFNTLKDKCGLSELRFHDLRHTAATRMIEQGVPLQEVGRVLGHTQANTTYRYINLSLDTAKRAALALDTFHEKHELKDKEKNVLEGSDYSN